jgi:hypothetical protein
MDEIPEIIEICQNGLGGFYLFFNLPDGRLTFWVISSDQKAKDELDAWSRFKKEWSMKDYAWYKEQLMLDDGDAHRVRDVLNIVEGE